jgi:electron transport complex protein RnfD
MKKETSSEHANSELVVEPAPHVTGPITKDLLMEYVFVALLILVGVSYFSWGVTSLLTSAIAVLVAVSLDYLLFKVAADSPLNTMSAAVFGLIVALSYSLGEPLMHSVEVLPLQAPQAYMWVAITSAVGLVIFKKIQGIGGRKYVNPAATAKLVVMLPFFNSILRVADHLSSSLVGMPALTGPIGYAVLGNNGAVSFAAELQSCFGNPAVTTGPTVTFYDVFNILFLQKFHGWTGGASSLAVIIVGIGFFIVARKYVKWRITLSYLIVTALMSLLMTAIYGGDVYLRLIFELFVGSSIFLAFFMATDPATTPLTNMGQGVFGAGLGILTVLIQTYMSFFGGSILALVIMNLTVPLLDRVGIHKPFGRR